MKKFFSLFFALAFFGGLFAYDMGAVTVITPSSPMCPSGAANVTVRIKNFSGVPIDFSVNNVTVTVTITGSSTPLFSTTLVTGTLNGGITQNVVMTVGGADLSVVGTHTFTITVSVAGPGGPDTDASNDVVSEDIVVEEPIIADRTTTVCSGSMFTDTPVDGVGGDVVPAGTTYDWGDPIVTGGITGGAAGVGQASISGTLTNPTSSVQTATYTVTPTSGGASCVGAPFEVVVTVNPTPVIADATDAICSGATFTVTPVDGADIVPVGTTYDWGVPAVTGGITGGASGATQPNISGTLTNPTSSAQTATYTVTPTSGTCVGADFDLVVTVNPIPVIANKATTTCSGVAFSEAPVDGAGGDVVPAGTTYDWGAPAVSGGMTGGVAGVAEADINGTLNNPTLVSQTGTYTVTPSISGCSGAPFDVVVTVDPAPIVVDEATSVCSGSGFVVSPVDGGANSIPVGTTYSWGAPAVTGGITGGAAGAAEANINGTLTNPTSSSETATYTVTPSFAGCDGTPFEVVVTVDPMPAISNQTTNTCSDAPFSYTPIDGAGGDIVPAGTTYDWGMPGVTGGMTGGAAGVTQADINGTLSNPTSSSQTGTYTVTPTAGTCVGADFDLVVTVDPTPVIADEATTTCSGTAFSQVPVDGAGGDIVPAGTTYDWGVPAVSGGMTGGAAGLAEADVNGTLTNITSVSQTGTYTVTPSAGLCVGAPFDVVVTVDPTPTIADATDAICSGGTFTVAPVDGTDIVPVGTVYDWGVPIVTGGITGGASGVTQPNISGTLTNPSNSAETATYTITPSVGGCTGPTFELVVTVNPTPVIADEATSVCSGVAFSVAPVDGAGGNIVPPGTTYDWGAPIVTGGMTGGAAGITQADVNGTLTNGGVSAETGTYTVTPSISGACAGATFEVVVTVDVAPSYTLVANDPSGCGLSDGSITITGLDPSTNYNISYDDDAVPTNIGTVMTTVGGTYDITGLNQGSYDNFLIAIAASGCSTADLVGTSLTDPGGPDVDDIPNQILCDVGYTLPVITGTNLSGSEGYYSGINGTGTNYPVGTVISVSGTLIYIYDVAGLCTSQENFTVTINVSPVVGDETATICSGGTFTTTPADGAGGNVVPAGTTYDWGVPVVTGGITGEAAGVGQANISGTLNNPTSSVETATYTVTPTADGCAGATFEVVVTVNPFSTIADEAASACSGTVFSVTPLDGVGGNVIPAGTTYDWGIPAVSGGITGEAAAVGQADINGTLSNSTNVNQTATYTVTPTSGTCPGATFDVVITVNPTPASPAQTANVCSGNAFAGAPTDGVPTAATIIPVGTTYDWLAPSVTGSMTGGAAGVTQANVNGTLTNPTAVAQTGTYTITPTSGTCIGADFILTVTVNPSPSISDDAVAICSGNAFTVAPVDGVGGNIVPAGTTYDWGVPAVTGGITGGVAGVGEADVNGTLTNPTSSVQTATYTVTPSSGGCTGAAFDVIVTVNPTPVIADDATTVCSGVAFSVAPVDGLDIVPVGTTYDWGVPIVTGGMTGEAAGVAQVDVNGTLINNSGGAETGTYTVTPTAGTCAGATFEVVVTVDDAPLFGLTPADPSVCGNSDGSITITGLNASTNYDVSYDDDAVPVNLGTVTSTVGGTYVISALNAGSYDNFVVAISASGCSTTDAVGTALVNPGAPDLDDLPNQVLCDVGYTLPVITGTNLTGAESYYDGAGGTGTAYPAGTVINTSMTMYIYDDLLGCSDQENFTITINTTPVVSDKTVSACTASAFNVTPVDGVGGDVVPGGTTYDWGVPAVTGGMTGGAAGVAQASIGGTITNSTSAPQTATYTVTPTSNGCVGTVFTVTATINPIPVIPDQTGLVCTGSLISVVPVDGVPTVLTVVPAGLTYDWGLPAVTGGMTGGAAGVGQADVNGTLNNSTFVSQVATYTVTPTFATCIGATFDAVVTVDPATTLTLTSAVGTDGQTLCENTILTNIEYTVGGNVTGASITAGSLPAGVNGAFAAGVFTISGTPTIAGPYSYTVTTSGGVCTDAALAGTIAVESAATITLTSAVGTDAQTICINTALTDIDFTVGGAATGASITAGALPAGVSGSFAGGVFTISGTPTAAGSFVFTVTTSGGTCVPAASISGSIDVDAAPTNVLSSAIGTDAQTLCEGTLLTDIDYSIGGSATGASITAGALPAGVSGSFAAGTFTISGTPTATGSFTYTVTTSGGVCTGVSLAGTIDVDAVPTLALSSAVGTDAQAICENTVLTDITFTIGGGATSASITAGSLPAGVLGSFAAGVFTISGTPTASGSYAFTVTTSGGTCVPAVALSGTIDVTVAPSIVLSSAVGTDAQTLCSNTALTDIDYTIGGGATSASITAGSLPTGVSLVDLGGGLFSISGTPIGAGSYSYTISTTGGSCAAVDMSGTIDVVQEAIALSSAAFTNSQSICLGSSVIDITYAVTGGATGAYISAGALPAGITGTFAAGVFTLSGTPTAVGTFFYDVTTTGPCGGATEIGSIKINPVLAGNAAGSDITICEGTSTSLIGGSLSGGDGTYTYLWESSTTSGGPYSSAAGVNNGSNYTTGNLVTDTYFIRTITSGGCTDQSLEVAVTIDPLPTASAGGVSTICTVETATVSGASSTNGSILWTHNGAGAISNGTTLTPTYAPTSADAGNTITLTMTVTGLLSCGTFTATADYTVNVNPLPTASAGGSSTICSNGTVTVNGANATNGTILWTHDGAGSLSNATTLAPTYIASSGDEGNTVTLTMTVSSTVPCVPPVAPIAIYTVIVNPPPAIPVNAGVDDSLSLGSTIQLNAIGGAIVTWDWTPALTLDNAFIYNPMAAPDSTTTYTVVATHLNGCTSTDSITIVVVNDFSLTITNTMTPNGDGINDYWYIQNIENYPNTEVIVVNREGQIVFEDANYSNNWDGKFNGKYLPDATYYYIVKFATSDKLYKGAITILQGSSK